MYYYMVNLCHIKNDVNIGCTNNDVHEQFGKSTGSGYGSAALIGVAVGSLIKNSNCDNNNTKICPVGQINNKDCEGCVIDCKIMDNKVCATGYVNEKDCKGCVIDCVFMDNKVCETGYVNEKDCKGCKDKKCIPLDTKSCALLEINRNNCSGECVHSRLKMFLFIISIIFCIVVVVIILTYSRFYEI